MLSANRLLKLLLGFVFTALLVNVFLPAIVIADGSVSYEKVINNKTNNEIKPIKAPKKGKVVVSMGDSYSSGEGIEPFYGSVDSKGLGFSDWLAHRSQYSWGGQLILEDVGELKSSRYGEVDYPNWYFVASSGAETKDICGVEYEEGGVKKTVGQYKRFSTPKDKTHVYLHDEYLEPQINALYRLKEQGIVPDYIIITIGGNDLGFVDVVTTAALKNNYLNPFSLYRELKKAEEKLDTITKEDLYKTYVAINNAAKDEKTGNQPYIIVAGYPALLDINGKGLCFNKTEAKWINQDVNYFNNAIMQVVDRCSNEGIEIEYVDVMKVFETHEAYSHNNNESDDGAWINGIIIDSKRDDIDKSQLVSAASFHPNKTGAKNGYAVKVQEAINDHEKELRKVNEYKTPTLLPSPTSTPTATPTPIPDIPIDKNYFPDKEFRSLIKDQFDTNHDGKLSIKERNDVKEFDTWASSDENGNHDEGPYVYGINSFVGLEYFTNLESIEIVGGELFFINFTKNPKLKYITFYENYCENIVVRVDQSICFSQMLIPGEKVNFYCKKSSDESILSIDTESKTSFIARKPGKAKITLNVFDESEAIINVEVIDKNSESNATPPPTATPTPTNTPKPTNTPVPDIAIDKNHFPDSEFRRLVKDKFDSDKNGKLSKKEISKVKKFDTYDTKKKGEDGPYTYAVKNPKGIEYFTELTEVTFKFSQVTTLDISKNKKLKKVIFFDGAGIKTATMLKGQKLEISFMEDEGMYAQGDTNLYCTTKNTSIVKISRSAKKSNKTLITAQKKGTAKVTVTKYNQHTLTITVK